MTKLFSLLLCAFILFPAFGSGDVPISPTAPNFEIKMELTENYSNSDPFINARLFYVTDDVDTLNLDIALQLKGETGLLEIADNDTDEVLWRDNWNENIENTAFTVSLHSLHKDREYVIRFTGTKIQYANIVVTSDNERMKERTRPAKKNEK